MGRVTRSRYQQLHTYRITEGHLESAAERWWAEIGGPLRGGDPRVVDAWLDSDQSSFLLVLADRQLQPLEALLERGQAVLGADLEEVSVHNLTGFHQRHLFAGESARPDPTLPSPKPTRWHRVDIAEDDRTLRVAYLRGRVTHLHHVQTSTDQWNVEVTVFLGYDRSFWERAQQGEQIAVTAIGISEWTEIELSEPVGDRFVLDGAQT